MEINEKKSETITEEQSFKVIREMIQLSQKKIKTDGILLLIWGYAMSVSYLSNFNVLL